MRLFSELKRRNVFRMAVLYVLAAWLIMQVAEVSIGLANLADWIGPAILGLLALGFPIALILSWFYELTPDGVTLEKGVEPGRSIPHVSGRRLDFVIISMLCAAVILFAYDKWWIGPPPEQSIAVLPFENMSADPEQEYFSDGISEELLNLLAKLPALKVTARTSSFSYRGQNVDIAAVAEELNVRHVLEGSVRRAGNQVRVTAQLIDTADSTHLWSEIYERELTASNLFFIQTEIATAIAGQLAIALTEKNEQQLASVPTENTDAYAAYMLGRHRLTDRKVAELAEAAEQFAYAIELDPNYAAAYAGLHDACALFEIYSGGNVHDICPGQEDALEPLLRKALALDETLGEAWISLGFWHLKGPDGRSPEQFAAAEAAITRGLELSPSLSQGYLWYSNLLNSNLWVVAPEENYDSGYWARYWSRWEEVKAVARRGLEVDPLSVTLHYIVTQQSETDGDFEAAMWHAERIVEIAPDSPRGYERLAELSWSVHGRVDQSIRWASNAAALDPDHAWYPLLIGSAYTSLGEPDTALQYLARALRLRTEERSEQVVAAKSLALLASGRKRESELLLTEFLAPSERTLSLGVGMVPWLLAGIDLAAGRADVSLARYQRFAPSCFDAEWRRQCSAFRLQFARVMQELGDEEQAYQRVQKEWDLFQAYGAGRQLARLGTRGIGIWNVTRLALLGRHDEALDELEEAVNAGWRGYAIGGPSPWVFHARFDMTLDAIRDDPRFQAAFAIIEADMAEQLESVREMERSGFISVPHEIDR